MQDFQRSLISEASLDDDSPLTSGRRGNASRKGSSSSSSMKFANMQASWYQDALQQSGGLSEMDLSSLLAAAECDDDGDFYDTDVLEQYRLMAQHEAHRRANQALGYNVQEKVAAAEAARKAATADLKPQVYASIPAMPDLPVLDNTRRRAAIAKLEPIDIPMPWDAARTERFRKQTCRREPQLQTGTTVRLSGGGTITTRCLGCKVALHVSQLATLVLCPECHVVSPATGSRH